MKQVFISDDLADLENLLKELSPPERCCTINNWKVGGQVYFDYIMLKEKLDSLTEVRTFAENYNHI